MKKQTVKGYKVFNPDFTCKGFQFEIDKEYVHNDPIVLCQSGFHFCLKANDCFNYYDFDPNNIVCEVEALGKVEGHSKDTKQCTDHIKIIRQLTWQEVLIAANDGSNNTGRGNSGNRNSGNRNSGNSNSGDSNSGDRNSGNRNSGNRNSGNWNSGDSNSGNSNSGNSNSGNWNSGNRNSGDSNSGYSNSGNSNSGAFCTGEKTIKLFNKDSVWTIQDFENSKAFSLLYEVDIHIWVPSSHMTEDEKTQNSSHETTEGFLRKLPFKEAFNGKWSNWSDENKKAFTSLPNFDKDIFFEITGVKV